MTPTGGGVGVRAGVAERMRVWMLQEAREVRSAAERLEGDGADAAFGLLAGCTRLVAVTGIGTSGLVAAKLAATFTSSGTRLFSFTRVTLCTAGSESLVRRTWPSRSARVAGQRKPCRWSTPWLARAFR